MHFYDQIPDDAKLLEWVCDQKIFHVASAPLSGEGHVNVSPKGQDSFKVMNPKVFWYLDLTGSGNETISHLYEPGNGRMTVLFQAFEGAPRLLRLFGKGRVIEYGTKEFDELLDPERRRSDDTFGFPPPQMLPGARAIIWLDIIRVGTSCGFSVPFMKFEGHRNTLNDWARKREIQDEAVSEDENTEALPPRRGLKYYWISTNSWSLDGLPGLKLVAPLATKELMTSTIQESGLRVPTFSSTTKQHGLRGQRLPVPWLLGFMIVMLLFATMQRGLFSPSLTRHLDFPEFLGRARHLLGYSQ